MTTCARCGATAGNGFIAFEKEVRVIIFLKFRATLKAVYCPRCGFLRISVAGIKAENIE